MWWEWVDVVEEGRCVERRLMWGEKFDVGEREDVGR